MEFYYVSQWTSRGGGLFELNGVLVVGHNQVGAYFPNDPVEEAETRRLSRKWKQVRNLDAALRWLRTIAQSGNGITEEYDEVRIIAAPSLKEALREAYAQTEQEYGTQIRLYESADGGPIEDLGDPFAALFPEAGDAHSRLGFPARRAPAGS